MWLTTVFFQIWCLCWAFLLMRWGTFFCLTLTQLMLRSDWRRSCQRGTERMRCSSHGMGTRVPFQPGKDFLANPRMAPVSSSSCEWHNYLMINVHARAFRTPAFLVFIAFMFRFGWSCTVNWDIFILSIWYSHQQVVLNQKECDELVLVQELFFEEFARPDSSNDWELNRPNWNVCFTVWFP